MRETKQITIVKCFLLYLNTFGRAEETELKAIAFERPKLIEWYENLKVDSYQSENSHYTKSFKEGSPLEFNNPLYSYDVNHWGQGIIEEWLAEDNLLDLPSTISLIE